jgi:peroxin-2
MHGALTLLLPYCHNRLRLHALSNAWPDAPSSDYRRKAWDALNSAESIHALLGLANFIAFLWNGRYCIRHYFFWKIPYQFHVIDTGHWRIDS